MKQYRHLFLSLIFTLSLTSAHAQLAIISEAVAELIENARRAASEENYSAAIEQLRMAEVVPNITQKENAFVQKTSSPTWSGGRTMRARSSK